jgi:hypothetical protein
MEITYHIWKCGKIYHGFGLFTGSMVLDSGTLPVRVRVFLFRKCSRNHMIRVRVQIRVRVRVRVRGLGPREHTILPGELVYLFSPNKNQYQSTGFENFYNSLK